MCSATSAPTATSFSIIQTVNTLCRKMSAVPAITVTKAAGEVMSMNSARASR